MGIESEREGGKTGRDRERGREDREKENKPRNAAAVHLTHTDKEIEFYSKKHNPSPLISLTLPFRRKREGSPKPRIQQQRNEHDSEGYE